MEGGGQKSRLGAPVLCVGTIAYDRIERPGHEPWEGLGGSGVFTAQAAVLFAPTRLRSIIGHDFAAEDFAHLRSLGLDCGGIERNDAVPTFRWGGRYSACMNRRETMFMVKESLESWTPEVTADDRTCSGGILLSSISPTLQDRFLQQWDPETRPFCVVDTFDHWIKGEHRENLEAVLRCADLILVNEDEARLLAGEGTASEQGARLLETYGTRPETMVIVKNGSEGATLCQVGKTAAIGVVPGLKVVDATGAGDAFAGALLGRLAQRGAYDFAAVREALPWTAAAASFMIEGLGGDCFPRDLAAIATRRAMVSWQS